MNVLTVDGGRSVDRAMRGRSSAPRGSAWNGCLQHVPSDTGDPNDDEPSPTHDRGHAGTEPVPSDAEFLRSASFHVRPAFQQIPSDPGAPRHSGLPALSDES